MADELGLTDGKPTKGFAIAEAVRFLEAAQKESRAADRDILAARARKILRAAQ